MTIFIFVMKKIFLIIILIYASCALHAQELYVNSEPASNMATRSLGIRLENQGFFKSPYKSRTTLELMYGASKNLMLHGTLHASNFYQPGQRLEGAGIYAK